MESNSILKYLHRQRAITYHERPVLSYPIRVTDQISDNTGMSIVLTGTGSNLNLSGSFITFPKVQPTTRINYFFEDIPERDKDVITICQEAINGIENIVNECESKFGTGNIN